MKDFVFDDNFDKILNVMESGAKDAVNDTVDAIVPTAAEEAPKDSTAMSVSIYAVREGDDPDTAYNTAKKRVEAANPKVEVEPRSVFDDYSEEGIHAAHVDVITPYAPLIHNGYTDVEGRPFLEKSGNQHKSTFEQNLARIGNDLERI